MDDSNVRGNSPGGQDLARANEHLVRKNVRDEVKHFCSIEYVDEEGDKVVQHAFLTHEEKKKVLFQFTLRGLTATIYDTTPDPAVSSEDDPVEKID